VGFFVDFFFFKETREKFPKFSWVRWLVFNGVHSGVHHVHDIYDLREPGFETVLVMSFMSVLSGGAAVFHMGVIVISIGGVYWRGSVAFC
jgi:hypothetical protein